MFFMIINQSKDLIFRNCQHEKTTSINFQRNLFKKLDIGLNKIHVLIFMNNWNYYLKQTKHDIEKVHQVHQINHQQALCGTKWNTIKACATQISHSVLL